MKAINIVSNFEHYSDDNDHHSHIFDQVKDIVVEIRDSVELAHCQDMNDFLRTC